MAASSSSVVLTRKEGWTYDVFLSFRGEDTRNNFVDHLYEALVQKRIHTFKDDEMLGGGQPISQELLKAIKESRWAVVVFSKHYANSSWCLEELSNIMECHKQMGGHKKVLPVFYHVDPSEVRKQNGDFAAAFENHEDKFKGGEMDKVNKWREALTAAGSLSGQHILPDHGGETSFINKIVQQISSDIQPRAFGMEYFVFPIITPVVESVLGPVKRHLGFLFSSTKYVSDMRVKLTELNSTATEMRRRKEHNDENTLMVPVRVPSWLEEAQVIIDNEGDSISAGGNGYLHIKKRYKTGKDCFNVIERIDRLMEEKSNMEWTNEQIPLGMVSSATPQVLQDVTQNIFGSRKEIFQKALQLLEPDNTTQKVALCGMGGIGKTTMMEELKKVVENRKLFDRVVRVVIGNSTDLSAFQKAIADYVGGGNLSESTREARADRLKERFLGMSQDGKKKILIILDDLWNIVDLKDIGLASPLPKGFKLFLTSRYETLCHQMGVETSSILRMVGLKEAEAKHLFWETMGLSDGAGDQELHKLGEDIVMRCGGLPMAIKTIALALTGEIKDAWRVTLLRLRRHDLQDLQGHYDVVNDIFEISYDYLKKVDDKEIFILSGLFPDDFDIPLEGLMRYGWGLKLFDRVYSVAEARQRTNTSVHNLIRANLLVESDEIGCVKMHDLARSFVLSNISKFKQASIVNHSDMSEWPTQDTRESCERIFLKCKGLTELPRQFDYPDLKLLKLMMNNYKSEPLKFPDDFYSGMKQLQVISYHSIRYPSLVPISLQCSTSLCVLCLRSCSLMDDLSSIGQLNNLEILSFAYCGIKNLPSAVGKLRKLKLLDLTGCYELCIGDGVFQNLDNLEEIYMRNLYNEVISFTEDNCEGLEVVSKKLTALEVEFFKNNIRPDRVSFKNLERFRISIGCQLDRIYDYKDDMYSYENTLELVASCEEVRAFEINELFQKTEQLYLRVEDMNHLEDVLMHPSDQYSFRNLKHLSIENCENLKYLFTVNVASTLTNLEKLIVKCCDVLGSLVHDENNGAAVIKFHKLKCLELEDLPRFEGLCDNINIVIELPQLVELRLDDLPNITEDREKWGRSVEVIQDEEFSVPWSLGQYSIEITIRSCHALSTVIPSFAAPEKIEVLEVYDCSSIMEVFETKELENSPPTAIPRLKSITTHKLLNLKRLDIEKCHRLVDIFIFSTLGSLRLLEKLSIRDCEELKLIVREEHGEQTTTTSKAVIFSCLKSIILTDLPNLKGFFFGMNEFQLPLLDEVIINGCPQMMVMTSLPLRAPKLKYIDINGGKYCTPECYSFFTKATLPQTPSQSSDNTNSSTTISEEFLSYSYNMIEMNLEYDQECQVIFSYDELLQLQNLEKLNARYCESVLEVFDVGTGVGCSNSSQTVVKLPKLSDVNLRVLKSLKYIWKSNGRTILEFPNLTKLDIYDCPQLEHVFTSSMVGGLLKLKELRVSWCHGMEVIVKEDQEEEEEGGDGKVNEIRLPCLKSLELISLESLKGFCLGNVDYSLPSLDNMKIWNCKSLTIFTKGRLFVPKLKVIETSLGSIKLAEEQDVNSLIITKRQEVAGGDGTAGWICGVKSDMKFDQPLPVATMPLPLGTGNNLPFALGWGKKNPGTDLESVKMFLNQVRAAQEMKVDSWHVIMRMKVPKGDGSCDPTAPVELLYSLHAVQLLLLCEDFPGWIGWE